MFFSNQTDYALITIFGDNDVKAMNGAVSVCLPGTDVKILEPENAETLEQAAQNSMLVFIGISHNDDTNLKLGKVLQNNRLIVADVIAFCHEGVDLDNIEVLSKGFDGCVKSVGARTIEFKHYLSSKISKGSERLARLIQEEEYRRLSDALSLAPFSMIVFDKDKRAVFVSDHYFRAYPKIAPRLIRGLRVHDAFEIMITEEGVKPEDPRYDHIRQFWHNLNGSVEFSLDTGVSYRMKAYQLPNNRGTAVIGQNITKEIKAKDRS